MIRLHPWALLGILLSLLLTGGCASMLTPMPDSPFAPGLATGTSVDGLTVGDRLMESGEYDLALRAYYRAAATQGANADTLAAIGSATLKLGRIQQAEQVLRRAIETDQRSVPAWNNLGVALYEQGKTGEAARIFETAYALDNGRSDLIRTNLKRAQSHMIAPSPPETATASPRLIRRGSGDVLLVTSS